MNTPGQPPEDRDEMISYHLKELGFAQLTGGAKGHLNIELKRHIESKWPQTMLDTAILDPLTERILDMRGINDPQVKATAIPGIQRELERKITDVLSRPIPGIYIPGTGNIVQMMSHFVERYPLPHGAVSNSPKDKFLTNILRLQHHLEENIEIDGIPLFISLRQLEELVLTNNLLESVVYDPFVLNEMGLTSKEIMQRYQPFNTFTPQERTAWLKTMDDELWTTTKKLKLYSDIVYDLGIDADLATISTDSDAEYEQQYVEAMRKTVDSLKKELNKICSLPLPVSVPHQIAPVVTKKMIDLENFAKHPIVVDFLTLDETKITYEQLFRFDLKSLKEQLDVLAADTAVMDQIRDAANTILANSISGNIDKYLQHLSSPTDRTSVLNKVNGLPFTPRPLSIQDFEKQISDSTNPAHKPAQELLMELDLGLQSDEDQKKILFYIWSHSTKKLERDAVLEFAKQYIFDEQAVQALKNDISKATTLPPESKEQKDRKGIVGFIEQQLEDIRVYTETQKKDLEYTIKTGAHINDVNTLRDAIETASKRQEKLEQLYRLTKDPRLTPETLKDTITNTLRAQPDIAIKPDLSTVQHDLSTVIHKEIEKHVDASVQNLKEDLRGERQEELRSIDDVIMDAYLNRYDFNSVEEAEKIVSVNLKKIRQSYGTPIEKLPNEVSFQPGAMFHIQAKPQNGQDALDTFMRIKSIDPRGKISFEKSFHAREFNIPFHLFIAHLYQTAQNSNADLKVDFVMDSKKTGPHLGTLKDLQDAIARKRKGEVGSPELMADLAPGVEVTVGQNPDKKKEEPAYSRVKEIDEKGRTILLDNGKSVPFDEFYLLATHNDPGNYKGVWNTRQIDDDTTPEYLGNREQRRRAGVKNKKSSLRRISPVALFGVAKAYLENFKGERKRKKEMRELIAQIQLLKPGNKVRENARQTYFGKEKEKMQGMKAEYDILDNTSMRKKVHDFMKAVRPGEPNIHKNDGYVIMQGKLMPAFDARTKVKNMFIYLLERYGTPYPFEEVEKFKHDQYWLNIFAESETIRQTAIAKAHEYTNKFDGELEIWQLHSLFREQSEFFGYEFAKQTEDAHETGNANEAKLKEQQAKATVKTSDLEAQLVEYIEDARWDGIQLLFVKLTEKGLEPKKMFNLFLRMYSKMTFVKEGDEQKYRSEISRLEIQKIAKAVFPNYPELYFFFFRNEDNYSLFGSLLSNEAGWDGKWKKFDKGEIPSPSDENLYKKFTLEGDYSLLNGYANKRSRFMAAMEGPRESYEMSFDPLHDSKMWNKNPLLTASKRVFGFAAADYDIAGFKHGHWSNYMGEFLKQMDDFKNSPSLNDTDKLAYLNYIRKEFYSGMYSQIMTSGDNPATIKKRFRQMTEVREEDLNEQQAYLAGMSNKKSVRVANNFLNQFEKKLEKVGLGYNQCLAAATSDRAEHDSLARGSSPVLSFN